MHALISLPALLSRRLVARPWRRVLGLALRCCMGGAAVGVTGLFTCAAAATLPDDAALAYAIPAPARLGYEIKGEFKGFPYSAKAELLWKHDDTGYQSRMEVRHFLLGSRVQHSEGALTSQGLEPSRFTDSTHGEQVATFDHDKARVRFNSKVPELDLAPGAQDHLSIFIQLAALLGGNPTRFPPGTVLSFQTIDGHGSETWSFKVGRAETLKLPGGELSATKLVREGQNEGDTRAELWLAPAVGYLPVRIRLSQNNGDVVDQLWRQTQIP